ncbi:MAG: hypothetical protein LH609_11385, partial [Rudanella sp.]|nr:hypothetical protein [Rudanella sp.]
MSYQFSILQEPVVKPRPNTKANIALEPQTLNEKIFNSALIKEKSFFHDGRTIILNMDVCEGLKLLANAGITVNCIVSSPPFYGQRDYGVDGQIGLEEHPKQFIEKLVNIFDSCKTILADNGSMWV